MQVLGVRPDAATTSAILRTPTSEVTGAPFALCDEEPSSPENRKYPPTASTSTGQNFADDLTQEMGASQYADPPTSKAARIQRNGQSTLSAVPRGGVRI